MSERVMPERVMSGRVSIVSDVPPTTYMIRYANRSTPFIARIRDESWPL